VDIDDSEILDLTPYGLDTSKFAVALTDAGLSRLEADERNPQCVVRRALS